MYPLYLQGCSKQPCQEIDGCYFLQVSNSCIKYNDVEALDYGSAKTICTQHGGELLRIDSQCKQDTLGEILTNCLNVTTNLLVQGTKDDAGNWLFDDGTHMPYFNWNSDGGQPSNSINELYIFIKSMHSWKWHDFSGFNGRRFLCEIYA
ncbi:Hypothetical predicted protein [Mytilus galloprovincialis]|uniref:C-type lectin domain-containing protein n=1 Tax=Mytilus galloprovincialis TaxID=29158 RepID=A0A8B6CHD9_MYTGA|nr:Hypothetical predicted protein [Mytilus galloprovincialis]